MTIPVENTETIGLWTEYLLCGVHNLQFTSSRSYIKTLELPKINVTEALQQATEFLEIREHVGQKNKEHDFILKDGTALSVKTNISGDKICPNKVGQTTIKKLNIDTPLNYKKWVLENPLETFNFYLKHLFDAEHNIYVNYKDGKVYYISTQTLQKFTESQFTFTKKLDTWNESCTMKIDDKSIAEFQVHSKRNCVKCRFNMKNLLPNLEVLEYSFPKLNFTVKKKISNTFNYIGSKTNLLDFIGENVEHYTGKKIKDIDTFYDLFAGTSKVSQYFLENGCTNIITNDNMYYSYVISNTLNVQVDETMFKKCIEDIKKLEPSQGYISNTYADKRMYFTKSNANLIDSTREYIERNVEKDTPLYFLLLKKLLYSSSKVANISSTFGAYLKKIKASATKKLSLEEETTSKFDKKVKVKNYNKNVLDLVTEIDIVGEVCYLDPPYNSRKYSSNYFVLESIAKNNKPEVSDGITGIPIIEPSGSGDFCSKTKIIESFTHLFKNIKTNYLFMSYSSESLVDKQKIIEILESCNWEKIKVYTREYKRFKNNNNKHKEEILYEYLFACSKNRGIDSKV